MEIFNVFCIKNILEYAYDDAEYFEAEYDVSEEETEEEQLNHLLRNMQPKMPEGIVLIMLCGSSTEHAIL